jgi:hypothetical protein
MIQLCKKYMISVTVAKPVLVLLIGILQPILALAEEVWIPDSETDCRIEGWSKDRDKSGLKVRDAANSHASILGTLPAFVVNHDGHDFGIEYQIIGSHNGWIKITGSRDDPNRSNQRLRPTYSGTGWVPGESVEFRVQSGIGYVRPDIDSTKLLDLNERWLTPNASIERVVACYKDWALVDYVFKWRHDPGKPRSIKLTLKEQQASKGRAWFRSICGGQETTCEGSWP